MRKKPPKYRLVASRAEVKGVRIKRFRLSPAGALARLDNRAKATR